MRGLVAALTILGACYLPKSRAEWRGQLPPQIPHEDRCGTGALTDVGREVVHRLPYLQLAEETAVSVMWAGMPGDAPRVAVARADDSTRTVIHSVVARHPGPEKIARAQREELFEEMVDDDDKVDDEEREPQPEDFYELTARIAGLHPGRHHCYRLDSDRGPLTEWATLMTAPAADPKRVDRFLVLGDSGTGKPGQHALARQLARWPMDAILFLGDVAYSSGTHSQLQQRFFDVYAEIFQRVPVYAAIGNHDRRSGGGRAFYEALLLPGKQTWYSFDAGDVHFIVLDTTRMSDEQATWLDGDLTRATRRFTVVLGHHPPYTSGFHGGNDRFQSMFVPLLERHRVDLVLSGHDHHYERTAPNDGVVYIVSGGGGARLRDLHRTPDSVHAHVVHHYLVLEAHADRLRVRAIDIAGTQIDSVDIPAR